MAKEKLTMREIREMSTEELQKRIEDERINLEHLQFQHATSRIQDTSLLKKSKHTIAIMKTIVRERELYGTEPVPAAEPAVASTTEPKTEE
jgi:large subunit ribosomal protein L29